jgi:hypothetical protein
MRTSTNRFKGPIPEQNKLTIFRLLSEQNGKNIQRMIRLAASSSHESAMTTVQRGGSGAKRQVSLLIRPEIVADNEVLHKE